MVQGSPNGPRAEWGDVPDAALSRLAAAFFPMRAGPDPGAGDANGEAELPGFAVRYRTLLEQIPAIVFMAQLRDGKTEAYVSPHIEGVLGFSRDEWLHDPIRWYRQIHPDDRNRWSLEAAAFVTGGEPLRSVYRALARDGRVVWFQCDVKMVRHANGEPWFFQGVAVDITEIKNAELKLAAARDELEARVAARTSELARANTELRQEVSERLRTERELRERADILARLNADLEQFTFMASHDLLEPIRNITLCTQVIVAEHAEALPTEARELLRSVVANCTRMADLLRDLLNYAQVARPAGTPTLVAASDAAAVFDETVASLENLIRSQRAETSRGPLPRVALRGSLLGQVFQNLIVNAIRYRADDPPRIHASAVQSGSNWQFSVRDNGIGIAPDFHERVFLLFHRLDKNRAPQGTGVGLAICKRIVEDAGGRIWVDSTAGQGATFHFTLPAALPGPPSAAPPG